MWEHARGRDGEIFLRCRLDGNLILRVSSLDDVISRSVYIEGTFEPNELTFIRRRVQPGMTAIDVGANIGVHALTLADCVGPNGRVHAFEPSEAYSRLMENIRLNHFMSRVHLNKCALGATSGTLSLLRCLPGKEAFTSRGTPLFEQFATGESFEVSMVSLDEYSAEHNIERIHFLKLDVEGSEPNVLRGATSLLARCAIDWIMLEVNEACLTNCGSSPAELVDILREANYSLSVLQGADQLTSCPDAPTGNWTTVIARAPSSDKGSSHNLVVDQSSWS